MSHGIDMGALRRRMRDEKNVTEYVRGCYRAALEHMSAAGRARDKDDAVIGMFFYMLGYSLGDEGKDIADEVRAFLDGLPSRYEADAALRARVLTPKAEGQQ